MSDDTQKMPPMSDEIAAKRLELLEAAATAYYIASEKANAHEGPAVPPALWLALNEAEHRLTAVAAGEGWLPTCVVCGDDTPRPVVVESVGGGCCESCAKFIAENDDDDEADS